MNLKEPVTSLVSCEDDGTNLSNNPHIGDILEARLTRRQALMGGLSATTTAIFGGSSILSLAACSSDDGGSAMVVSKLGFSPVAKSVADLLSVPSGYTASVLWAMGDSFAAADPAWSDTGAETAESYNRRAGDHHDGLYYFGLNTARTGPDVNNSTRGILAMNHEALNPFNVRSGVNNLYIHPNGATVNVTGTAANSTATPPIPESRVANRTRAEEVRKEVNTHGVSIFEVTKTGSTWSVVKDSPFNRRVTGATTMEITGPLRGNAALITKFSPTATQTQGTINNCANGYTPWGTYLTCEENWVGYFARAAGDNARRTRSGETASLARYGSSEGALQRGNWSTVSGGADEFARWDTSVRGVSANGSDDFRNVINQFGYVVEIDPYNPAAVPAKRTALGRFAHEGAWPGKLTVGKPVVFYMGDDNRNDYIYKFVSTANWVDADANPVDRMATGAKYLDSGKLFVAKFNADGSGSWVELTGVQGALDTRIAADAAGATRMDRPEWGAVNPLTGEVYMTLTNNGASQRTLTSADAANPRAYKEVDSSPSSGAKAGGNPNGHIIRWRETGDDSSATTFKWDIYLFGARAAAPANINLSKLSADNDFSSPDGLWFSRPGNPAEGILWIQTDDGAYTDVTNCMLLAAVPGSVGDGATASVTSTSGTDTRTVTTFIGKEADSNNLRRFLIGPKECEITGIDSTPDGKTLFINIQHPGEDKQATLSPAADPASFGSRWPGNQFAATHSGNRPRSATIVITRNDGGVIGI